MTKGEDRVRTSFNPSKDSKVDGIKALAASLIDAIESINGDSEVQRLKALAQTAAEESAMWGVKAATAEK